LARRGDCHATSDDYANFMPQDGTPSQELSRTNLVAQLAAREEGLSVDIPEPTPAQPPPTWLPPTFRALRHRNYRLYFFGQLISLIGTWVQTAALMWLAFKLTGETESSWSGWIVAAQILPTFFLGGVGGMLADHLPKRGLIIATQSALLVQAVLLAILVMTREVELWQLLAINAFSGLVNALDLPARLTFVMEMVGRGDLPNAVALNSLVFNAARLVGPLVASVLLVLGPGVCFLINALSYVAVLIALVSMRGVVTTAAVGHAPSPSTHTASVAYIAGNPGLALLFLLTAVVSVFGWPFQALLPALAKLGLQLDSPPLRIDLGASLIWPSQGYIEVGSKEGYGLMLSGAGMGALVAALIVATFTTRARRRLFLTSGMVVVVIGLIGLSAATKLPWAVLCCALVGCGMILFLTTGQAIVQLSAGPDNRGRIMGLYAMVVSGAAPLGNLMVGPAADRWGVAQVLFVQGVACATAAVGVLALLQVWKRVANGRPSQ
jgi:MFS family permease